MKTIPAGLLAHYQGNTTTVARCLKLTRQDGSVIGFTNARLPLRIDAVLYRANALVELSDAVAAADLSADNAEARITPDDAQALTRADILAGLWDNAAWEMFEVDYTDVSLGVNAGLTGTLGDHRLNRGEFAFELRGLLQALQQAVGDVTSVTCRYRLGDARCTKDLAAFTFAGSTVTSDSGSRSIVNASARTEAADYFAEGEVTFTTGTNAGLRRKVKSSTSGVLTLNEPLPYDIDVGDVFTAIAGCRKRALDDCKTKFDNLLNFGGEPDLPGLDTLSRPPTVDV